MLAECLRLGNDDPCRDAIHADEEEDHDDGRHDLVSHVRQDRLVALLLAQDVERKTGTDEDRRDHEVRKAAGIDQEDRIDSADDRDHAVS